MPATETTWATDWPGREFGIRRPYPGETPLSWPEVMHAMREVFGVSSDGVVFDKEESKNGNRIVDLRMYRHRVVGQ